MIATLSNAAPESMHLWIHPKATEALNSEPPLVMATIRVSLKVRVPCKTESTRRCSVASWTMRLKDTVMRSRIGFSPVPERYVTSTADLARPG